MVVLNIIVNAIIVIALAILFTFLISILSSLDDCLKNYGDKLAEETGRLKSKRMTDLTHLTKVVRNMIQDDIMTEIDIYIQEKTLTHEKIVMLNLDKDIEKIANSVYDGYSRALVDSGSYICSTDHIKKEIINYTTILLSTRAVDYNSSFAQE